MNRRQATRAHDAATSIEAAPPFMFKGLFIGKVVSVYDGDTCRVAFAMPTIASMPSRIVTYPVRTLLFDAPEKKGASLEYGLEVREVLTRLVLGRTVALYVPGKLTDPHFDPVGKGDPYRRMLGHLFVAKPRARRARWWDRFVCGRPVTAPDPQQTKKPETKRRRGYQVTVRDNKDGSAVVDVRGRDVHVPATADIPRGFRRVTSAHVDGVTLPGFIHVNRWMLENARVKSCVGSRDGYSTDELRDGVN